MQCKGVHLTHALTAFRTRHLGKALKRCLAPLPLVSCDLWRRQTEGLQHLAQRPDLSVVRVQKGEVIAAPHRPEKITHHEQK